MQIYYSIVDLQVSDARSNQPGIHLGGPTATGRSRRRLILNWFEDLERRKPTGRSRRFRALMAVYTMWEEVIGPCEPAKLDFVEVRKVTVST